MCHVVAAKKHHGLYSFIPTRLLTSPPIDNLLIPETPTNDRILWELFLPLVLSGSKGPFLLRAVEDYIQDLVTTATKLFPFGLPSRDWTPSHGTIVEYNSFLSRIYRRTPVVPISTRWYTVESSAFFYYSMYLFDVLDNFILDTVPHHWPGDGYQEIDDEKAYKDVVKTRITRLRTYVASFNFIRDSVVAMITSFPRWRMVRKLESIGEVETQSACGIIKALDSFRHETITILSCGHPLAEAILQRECKDGTLRIDVYRGLLTASLYMAIKHDPLKSTFWQTVLAKADPLPFIERNFDRGCCSETGTIAKITKERSRLTDSPLQVSDSLLATSITSLSATCFKKGFMHEYKILLL